MADSATPRIYIKLRIACPQHLESELQSISRLTFVPQSSRRVIALEGIPVWQSRVYEAESWDVDSVLNDALVALSDDLDVINEFCTRHNLPKWLSTNCEFIESAPSVVLPPKLLKTIVERGLWLDLHMDLMHE